MGDISHQKLVILSLFTFLRVWTVLFFSTYIVSSYRRKFDDLTWFHFFILIFLNMILIKLNRCQAKRLRLSRNGWRTRGASYTRMSTFRKGSMASLELVQMILFPTKQSSSQYHQVSSSRFLNATKILLSNVCFRKTMIYSITRRVRTHNLMFFVCSWCTINWIPTKVNGNSTSKPYPSLKLR